MIQKKCGKVITIGTVFVFIMAGFISSITGSALEKQVFIENEKKYSDNDLISNTYIVDVNGAGNYTTIQEAIDNATEGDIIRVWDGIYNENIIINKTLHVFGNSSKTTTIAGVGFNNSVVTIVANEAIFSGFDVRGGDFIGIELVASEGVIINDNNINNNTYGIWVLLCDSNTIEDNNIINNDEEGVSISVSIRNLVARNNFINNAGEIGHAFFWNSLFNKWQENYWDDYTGDGAKKIEGQFNILSIPIPWANYDRNPATEPYDIE